MPHPQEGLDVSIEAVDNSQSLFEVVEALQELVQRASRILHQFKRREKQLRDDLHRHARYCKLAEDHLRTSDRFEFHKALKLSQEDWSILPIPWVYTSTDGIYTDGRGRECEVRCCACGEILVRVRTAPSSPAAPLPLPPAPVVPPAGTVVGEAIEIPDPFADLEL